MDWATILAMTLATIGQLPADPVFWLVVVLVAFLYRRVEGLRQKTFGLRRPGAFLVETLKATVWGLGGGLFGSLVMVLAGVTLSASSLAYLWPLAILLMFINARFLCFSYAGGILALANLLFGWPALDVAQLMALVAVLHLVESLLILVSGHRGAVPTYVRSSRGEVVGGFVLQKFWPLPVVALVALQAPVSGLSMPGWWPLLGAGPALAYGLIPVVAALGYGDLALARAPEQKSRQQFAVLFLYSLILLALAVLSRWEPFLLWVAALFAPLGHEGVIHLGSRLEYGGPTYYARPARGVRVLDVWPGSPFWRAGVRAGDVIAEAGEQVVNSRRELLAAVAKAAPLDIVFFRDRQFHRGIIIPVGPSPGLVTVPEPGDEPTLETGTPGRTGFYRWLTWRRKRI
ncbi:MAG TPA: PDZ domain-containing protein [Spirochaetia bacterium]|nr:PDZ domain-containing protein [Spirochaetia bacterium]